MGASPVSGSRRTPRPSIRSAVSQRIPKVSGRSFRSSRGPIPAMRPASIGRCRISPRPPPVPPSPAPSWRAATKTSQSWTPRPGRRSPRRSADSKRGERRSAASACRKRSPPSPPTTSWPVRKPVRTCPASTACATAAAWRVTERSRRHSARAGRPDSETRCACGSCWVPRCSRRATGTPSTRRRPRRGRRSGTGCSATSTGESSC